MLGTTATTSPGYRYSSTEAGPPRAAGWALGRDGRPLRPVGVAGQLLGDPVVEALALQGLLDVGDDLAQRVGDLRLDLGDGRLGGPPFGRHLAGDAGRLGREHHLLAAGIGACRGT